MMRERREGGCRALLVASVLLPSLARADARACVDAADRGQDARAHHALLRARVAFAECADTACPGVVRRQCAEWLHDLETQIPSILVRAKSDAGADVLNARVEVDGTAVTARSVAYELELDPGEHRIAVASADGVRAEARIVLGERERARIVTIVLPTRPPRAEAPPPTPAPARSIVGPIVVAGTGVVALSVAAYLALSARSDADGLRETCAPFCDASAVRSIDRRALGADIALGVGIASVAVATAWLMFRPAARGVSGAATPASVAASPLGVGWAF